jgi:hypothetical protein
MLEVVSLKGQSKETLLKLERDELFSSDSLVSSQGTPNPDGGQTMSNEKGYVYDSHYLMAFVKCVLPCIHNPKMQTT